MMKQLGQPAMFPSLALVGNPRTSRAYEADLKDFARFALAYDKTTIATPPYQAS
jgi:hypothetical protein